MTWILLTVLGLSILVQDIVYVAKCSEWTSKHIEKNVYFAAVSDTGITGAWGPEGPQWPTEGSWICKGRIQIWASIELKVKVSLFVKQWHREWLLHSQSSLLYWGSFNERVGHLIRGGIFRIFLEKRVEISRQSSYMGFPFLIMVWRINNYSMLMYYSEWIMRLGDPNKCGMTMGMEFLLGMIKMFWN